MLRTICFFFITLFFVGCGGAPASINLTPNTQSVKFQAADCNGSLPLRYLGKSFSGGRISLERSFYQSGTDILIHEHGSLDDNFVFVVSLDSLVHFAFELKNLKLTSLGNFHTYFEGTSRLGQSVYIIAAGIGAGERFDVLYSDSGRVIKELASCVKNGGIIEMTKEESAEPKFPPKTYIRSDFGAALFFKHEITASKVGGDRRFR